MTDGEQTATFLVAHDADVAIGDRRAGLSGPAWEGVELTEVSVAALEPGTATIPRRVAALPRLPADGRAVPVSDPRQRRVRTDLSRQHVRVSEEAATTTRTSSATPRDSSRAELLPLLRPAGSRGGAARARPRRRTSATTRRPPACCTRRSPRSSRDVPLLPTRGRARAHAGRGRPPARAARGRRRGLPRRARRGRRMGGQRFPAAPFCAGRWAQDRRRPRRERADPGREPQRACALPRSGAVGLRRR